MRRRSRARPTARLQPRIVLCGISGVAVATLGVSHRKKAGAANRRPGQTDIQRNQDMKEARIPLIRLVAVLGAVFMGGFKADTTPATWRTTGSIVSQAEAAYGRPATPRSRIKAKARISVRRSDALLRGAPCVSAPAQFAFLWSAGGFGGAAARMIDPAKRGVRVAPLFWEAASA
jgi:hypothetical protein